jgi:uncharacterized protein
VDAPESLAAPMVIEFGFERTTGPLVGAFLAGLRDGVLLAATGPDGRVRCPPPEFDPDTGQPADAADLVPVPAAGTVTAWTWVPRRPADRLPHDFAWALIAIDGTTGGGLFHAVDSGGDLAGMATGMRVRARWRDRDRRLGDISDIECFEPVP